MTTPTDEFVILVAVHVTAANREAAHRTVMDSLPRPGSEYADSLVEAWWIAEDDRQDGSDNDSAVFVNPGSQHRASVLLEHCDLTYVHNIVKPEHSPGIFA